jgi:hypothetical protein
MTTSSPAPVPVPAPSLAPVSTTKSPAPVPVPAPTTERPEVFRPSPQPAPQPTLPPRLILAPETPPEPELIIGEGTIPYAVAVFDEGVSITTKATELNFVGSSVTTTAEGGVVTIQIDAGGGGGATIAAGTSISVSTASNVTTVTNTFTEIVYQGGNATGNLIPDRNNGTIQKFTLTGSITLNPPANMTAGQSLTLILTQDSAGNRTLTAGSSFKFASGYKTLSIGGNVIDMLNMFYDGTVYYCTLTTGYA